MSPATPGTTERDAAEALALSAMQFLASDQERLQHFLDLSGVLPEALRARLGNPDFLIGVLDHLLGDERLLLAFADWAALAPEMVGTARRALGGAWIDGEPI